MKFSLGKFQCIYFINLFEPKNNLPYVTDSNDADKFPRNFTICVIEGVPTSNFLAYSCIFTFFSFVSVIVICCVLIAKNKNIISCDGTNDDFFG